MGLLADALGIELSAEATEKAVDPYSADIVARDGEDAVVVVENQLEKPTMTILESALRSFGIRCTDGCLDCI